MSSEIARNFPPTAIITAEFDFLRRHAEELGALLLLHGRLVEFVVHPGLIHSWNFSMSHPKSDMYWSDFRTILEINSS